MNKGFTIIELIISIFILSIAIIGVYGAFSAMVILTSSTADRLTAAYLAQEGAEVIRNIRDNNWLLENTWDEGLSACKGGGCEVDYTTTGLFSNPVGAFGKNKLKKDTVSRFYNYETGEETNFIRKITIDCLPDNNCSTDYIMKVIVEVSWDEKPNILNPVGMTNSIKVEDTLYNWY